MQRVYAYNNYRKFLRDVIESKRKKNPHYSCRAIATHLGISSGTLSRILNESGPFTLSGIPAGTCHVNIARLSKTFTVLYSTPVEITTSVSHNCGTFTID